MKTAGYSHNCCLFTSFHASHQPASVRSATIYIIVFVSCLISPCPGPERQNAAGMNECYCCSVAKLCLILRDTMDRSIPGSSVFHYPRVCSNSCPLSRWCYLSISSSVTLFSFCLQSFSASGCFAKNQLFTSGGQSTGVSISAWVLPMNIQSWFLLGLTSLISLLSKGLSRVFSRTTVQKHQFFSAQPSLWSNSHIHTWLLEKS